ncbi:DUF1120 domain-containing protein [Enterobacter asburiae]|nr:DUF1120 domain-containing protein [Enterobacter asburiae]
MTQFNKKLSALAVCIAVLAPVSANAATETTLIVTGDFTPAACVPTLDNGGVVDFGSMNAAQLATATGSTGMVQLESKSINLTVTCDAAASVGIIAQDNRTSSKATLSATAYIENGIAPTKHLTASASAFGLGSTDDGKSIGAYTIKTAPAGVTVDGNAADVLYKDTSGSWTKVAAEGNVFYPDQTRVISVADTGKVVPTYFTELTLPLTIATAVQTKDKLGSNLEVKLDGNATISLVYL